MSLHLTDNQRTNQHSPPTLALVLMLIRHYEQNIHFTRIEFVLISDLSCFTFLLLR